MPVVVIPECFLNLASGSPTCFAECRVQGRTEPEIIQELFQQFPALYMRFKDTAGNYKTDWFKLYREQTDEWLADSVVGENERIHLINQIGC